MYLDGAYEGTIEWENQMTGLFLTNFGPIKIKYVFMEGFKVKVFESSLLGGNSEVKNYKIVGDRLRIQSNNKRKKKGKIETEGLKIIDSGYRLVMQTDEANIILRKIY